MLKRTVALITPQRVSVRLGQLVMAPIDDDSKPTTIPIEDIGFLFIENQRVSITLPAINELINRNVGVVICNSQGYPNAMLNPLDCNALQGQNRQIQFEASLPSKKAMWQQIVMGKIRNQCELLNRLGKDGDALKPYWKNVKSGDSDNREGVAAKLYWQRLFGHDFIRAREGFPPNNMLNYGYSILRSATARAIVGAGLWPGVGIHHHNRANPFPLADDFMEPFRPFVDNIVFNLYESGAASLNKDIKAELIKVIYADTFVNGRAHPLSLAISMLCTSAIKVMAGEEKTLNLPLFPELG